MRLRFAGLLIVLALAAGIPAALADDGQVREVAIPGKAYAPTRLQVLVGDTVVWRNGDATTHTVTADDGTFDSGYLDSGLSFSLQFSKLGHYAYHCSIHKFMHGEIVVVAVALQGPSQPVTAGGRVVLQGLAPVGVKSVVVTSVGPGPALHRHAVPAGDGSFSITMHVAKPVFVAARVGKLSSTPVRVFVAPHVRAHASGGVVTAVARPGETRRPGRPAALCAGALRLANRVARAPRLFVARLVPPSLGAGCALPGRCSRRPRLGRRRLGQHRSRLGAPLLSDDGR